MQLYKNTHICPAEMIQWRGMLTLKPRGTEGLCLLKTDIIICVSKSEIEGKHMLSSKYKLTDK